MINITPGLHVHDTCTGAQLLKNIELQTSSGGATRIRLGLGLG
jgi:hypothetical protein